MAAYRQHAAGLLRYAGKLSGDPDTARDAVQEAFLRYFVERNHGRGIEHPSAWLHKVTRNYLTDSFNATAFQEELTPQHLESVPDQHANPEAILRNSQLAREIAEVLSVRELGCLRLRAKGLCYADIAVAMGVQSGTVGALLSRVQKKLRPEAGHYGSAGAFEEARRLLAEV
jgi:RNA polymerase sigma-70 factor (ECF subfamily)